MFGVGLTLWTRKGARRGLLLTSKQHNVWTYKPLTNIQPTDAGPGKHFYILVGVTFISIWARLQSLECASAAAYTAHVHLYITSCSDWSTSATTIIHVLRSVAM